MTLGYENGTKFEFECYDVGHLYNLHYFHREGMLKGPYFIQFVMGIMGGIGADADNLLHRKKQQINFLVMLVMSGQLWVRVQLK